MTKTFKQANLCCEEGNVGEMVHKLITYTVRIKWDKAIAPGAGIFMAIFTFSKHLVVNALLQL